MPEEATGQQVILPGGLVVGYAEYGDAAGAPVVHFHGTPSSRLEGGYPGFDSTARRLGVRFIVPDRPGYGMSSYAPYTVAGYPDTVVAFADALGLRSFAVTGYSGGGRFAAACAWAVPERLTNVVIVSGAAPFDVPGIVDALSRQDRMTVVGSTRAPWLMRLMFSAWLSGARKHPGAITRDALASEPEASRQVMSRPGVADAFERAVLEGFAQGPRGAVFDFALIARPWGFSPADIRVPVHVWHGEADSLSIAHAHALSALIPGARTRYFPGEGHFLFVGHFEDVLRAALG